MSIPHVPKVAGIEPALPAPAHTADPLTPKAAADDGSDPSSDTSADSCRPPGSPHDERPDGTRSGSPDVSPVDRIAAVQDRLAGWISDLSTLHDLTELLAGTRTLDEALHELLRAGASLVGARRGLVVLAPADGLGPEATIG